MPNPEECLPCYPPRITHRQVSLWAVSELSDKPALPGDPPSSARKMRRLVERHVADREHREQLKAWARAQGDEASFRETCRDRGWDRRSAQRHVDKALAMLLIVMNQSEIPGGA